MPATMSVKGLYDWDHDLFNGLKIPAAMDKNALINYILMECSDLEVTVTDPETLRILIESWSISRKHSWDRLYESTVADFNMLHNYDRHEEWTDTGTGTGTGSNDSELRKAAYNNTDPVLAEKQHGDSSSSTTSRGTHNGHLYGNIGVTTSVQMLTEVHDYYAYDVYQAITDEFKHKFCICVY